MAAFTKAEVIWKNGELVPWADATTHLTTHALHYGTGVFEGMRAYETARGTAIFRHEEHLDRLYDSAKAIWLTIAMPKSEMAAVTEEAVRRSGIAEAYIRHIVTRGVGDLGLDPRNCPKPSVIIIVDTIRLFPEEVYETGVRVVTAGTPIPHREALSPRVKSLNYLAHILAKVEGIQAGADEVLMLDSEGHVAEGSGQNIFVVKNGVIRTPAAYAGILKGVTRDTIIELGRGAGYEVQETTINRYDVYTADEAFFTGTAAEITPIREFDHRPVGDGKRGPLTARLQGMFFDAVYGRNPARAEWLTLV